MWNINNKLLPYRLKHFYAYFCWFGPNTCCQWNCRLAKKFGVSRSTIKRYLKRLRELKLIWITSGGGSHRRIHTHYYSNLMDWFTALSGLPAKSHKTKKFKSDREKRLFTNRKALSF
jgi:DNA-binding GntR family transcriptional regulator